jgi:hypothetical protein
MTGQPCGPGDVERATHGKVLTLVIEDMEFGRIEENAAFDVPDEGVIRPAVPQPRNHIVELPRPTVTLVVLDVIGEAKI